MVRCVCAVILLSLTVRDHPPLALDANLDINVIELAVVIAPDRDPIIITVITVLGDDRGVTNR